MIITLWGLRVKRFFSLLEFYASIDNSTVQPEKN